MQSHGFEVRVAWQDRTLFCRYFSGHTSIRVGGKGADIALPMLGLTPGYEVKLPFHLKDDEEARVKVHGGLLDLYFRPLKNGPRPLSVPLLDMSSSEVTGVLLALAISLMLGLYMNLYAPLPLVDEGAMGEEKVIPKVRVLFREKIKVHTKPSAAAMASQQASSANSSSHPRPAPKSAPPRVRKSSPAKPAKPKALQTFGGAGLMNDIAKTLHNGSSLSELADQSTGRAGSSSGNGEEGRQLMETGSGRDGKTVGLGAGPGGPGRDRGGKGVFGVGGMAGKSGTSIQVGEQGASEVTGMDREAIRRVIREHLREIRNCYERQLQSAPDLHGKVVLEWDIVDSGRVANARVAQDFIGNSEIGRCLTSRLSTWKFPDPPAGQIGRVVYPFIFSSR